MGDEEDTDITSDEFAEEAAMAGLRACQAALDAGHPVVFVDEAGDTCRNTRTGGSSRSVSIRRSQATQT